MIGLLSAQLFTAALGDRRQTTRRYSPLLGRAASPEKVVLATTPCRRPWCRPAARPRRQARRMPVTRPQPPVIRAGRRTDADGTDCRQGRPHVQNQFCGARCATLRCRRPRPPEEPATAGPAGHPLIPSVCTAHGSESRRISVTTGSPAEITPITAAGCFRSDRAAACSDQRRDRGGR